MVQQAYNPYTPQINPYLLGYRNPQYSQSQGLASGVSMLGDDKIAAGWSDMMKSLGAMKDKEIADETERQRKYEEIIDYSLKDVKGRFRDEAVIKKNNFVDNVTKMAAKNKGKFSWEEQKKILQGKEELDALVGKSAEIKDWYSDAVKKAWSIKDPELQKEAFKNIDSIMNTGTIDDVYKETNRPGSWMPEKNYTVGDLGKYFTKVYKNAGLQSLPDRDKLKEQALQGMENNDPEITYFANKIREGNKDLTDEQVAERVAGMVESRMGEKPGTETKTIYKPNSGNTSKDDQLLKIKKLGNGEYSFRAVDGNKGLKVGSVKDEKSGKTYKNASIVRQSKDGNTVTIAVPKLNSTDIEELAKQNNMSVEEVKDGIMFGGVDIPKSYIDKIEFEEIEIPISDEIEDMIDQKVVRSGYVRKQHSTPKTNEKDPLGFGFYEEEK